ncbi:MAG: DUF4976 domain-containing protein [Balneolaceae bacterium]|nr:MAG: DUF4976 domain-containing protein [Balneolaceae bacterium]
MKLPAQESIHQKTGYLHITTCILFLTLVISGCTEDTDSSSFGGFGQPNIIVMYSDDHTAQAVGAYQGTLNYGLQLDHTPTPNIDRLAKKGIRFDNAFVTNSICKPSRAVLLSGLHSHVNGVITNGQNISIDLETFPMLLQESGYQTAMIGKWHLGNEDAPQGFDYFEVLYGQGPYYNPTMRTTHGDVDYHGHTTEIIGDIALRWLRIDRDRDRPFMLMYNHKAPHREWLPGPALDDYRDRDLPEPSTLFYGLQNKDAPASEESVINYPGLTTAAQVQDMEIGTTMTWGRDLKVPMDPATGKVAEEWDRLVETNRLTDEQLERVVNAYAEENEYLYENYHLMTQEELLHWRYQRYVKDYLRVVREVDDEVGRLMAYLERENLKDNTIVIYAGDQGFFLGEKGWFDKRWIYEESLRMPLIVHWPEGIDPGLVSKELVQNLDLAPTILELAGTQIPDYMQGRSMIPMLMGESPNDWRDAAYYHYFEGPPAVHRVARHYGIRTDRYTIAHFPDHDEWELFDLELDPNQIRNVYGEPTYTDIQEQLKSKLYELQEKYQDDTWSNTHKSDR